MNRDTIIYIHCPELIECPPHYTEAQLIDGLLKEIGDILKYSFVIGENRSLLYFGRRIDLDYRYENNPRDLKNILKYAFIFRDRTVNCECDITQLLNELRYEKAFIAEYTKLIKNIVTDIGEKTSKCARSTPVQVKYADLKKHYSK